MSKKDQLDEFLREKLSEREFPFQEAYWESAQALIEADEQHRRRWFGVWLNSMGLVLAGAALIAFVWWGISATDETDLAANRHTDTEWIAQAHVRGEESGKSEEEREKREDREQTASLSEVRQERGKREEGRGKSDRFAVRSQTAALVETEAANSDIPPNSQTTQTSNSLEQNREKSEAGMKTDATSQTAARITSQAQSIALSRIKRVGETSLAGKPDNVTISLLPQASTRSKKGRHTIGISLGMSLTNAWPSAESSANPAVLATALPGMYYQYKTGKGITLSTGVQYQSRSGLNVSHSYRSTAFAFGLDEEITTISPHSLHSLEVPIQLGIPLVGQHRLLLGADVAYLLNVESEVETISRNPFGTETRSKETGWGYTQGFKPFDIGIQAGYRYRIGRRMQVGMSLRYGLRDLTDNAFFDQNAVNRNVQIRFVWEQDLFRF